MGDGRRKPVEWQAPEGTAGPFTVTVEVDGPFKVKANKIVYLTYPLNIYFY